MKATLEFNLPKEHREHMIAVHASDFVSVLYELDQLLRRLTKYGHSFNTGQEALQSIRDALHSELSDRGISLGVLF